MKNAKLWNQVEKQLLEQILRGSAAVSDLETLQRAKVSALEAQHREKELNPPKAVTP